MPRGERRTFRLSDDPVSRTTSVCLELAFWDVLEHMAHEAGQTLSQLISIIDARVGVENTDVYENRTLASQLRVACLKWSASQMQTVSHTPTSGRALRRGPGCLQKVIHETCAF